MALGLSLGFGLSGVSISAAVASLLDVERAPDITSGTSDAGAITGGRRITQTSTSLTAARYLVSEDLTNGVEYHLTGTVTLNQGAPDGTNTVRLRRPDQSSAGGPTLSTIGPNAIDVTFTADVSGEWMIDFEVDMVGAPGTFDITNFLLAPTA